MFSNKKYSCYLKGYVKDSSLCPQCNATESVIARLKAGKEITKQDAAMLPSILVFDPKSNNPKEAKYGLQFMQLIESFKT